MPLDAGQSGVHAGDPTARDADCPRGGRVKADLLLQPAFPQPEQVADLRTGQIEAAGDPCACEVQGRYTARPLGVAAQEKGSHDLGADRALGPPVRPSGGIVVLRRPGPQIHPPPFGEGVPQRTLCCSQFVVDQHRYRLRVLRSCCMRVKRSRCRRCHLGLRDVPNGPVRRDELASVRQADHQATATTVRILCAWSPREAGAGGEPSADRRVLACSGWLLARADLAFDRLVGTARGIRRWESPGPSERDCFSGRSRRSDGIRWNGPEVSAPLQCDLCSIR